MQLRSHGPKLDLGFRYKIVDRNICQWGSCWNDKALLFDAAHQATLAEAERNVYEQAECSSSIAPRPPVINHPQPIYPVLTQHDSKPPQQVYQTPIVQDQTKYQNNTLQQLILQLATRRHGAYATTAYNAGFHW